MLKPLQRIVATILLPVVVANTALPSFIPIAACPSASPLTIERYASEALVAVGYNFGHERRGSAGYPELILQNHLYAAVAFVGRIASRLRSARMRDTIRSISVGIGVWEVAHQIWPQMIPAAPGGAGVFLFAGLLPWPHSALGDEVMRIGFRLLPNGRGFRADEVHPPSYDGGIFESALAGIKNPGDLIRLLRKSGAVDDSVLLDIEKTISRPQRVEMGPLRMMEDGDLEVTAHVIPADGYTAEDLQVEIWTHEPDPKFDWEGQWGTTKPIQSRFVRPAPPEAPLFIKDFGK